MNAIRNKLSRTTAMMIDSLSLHPSHSLGRLAATLWRHPTKMSNIICNNQNLL
jgi:hypothetical protein